MHTVGQHVNVLHGSYNSDELADGPSDPKKDTMLFSMLQSP